MTDYLRIARVYLCATTVGVWCFLFLCLLAVSAGAEEFARTQGNILDGVLSKKSYMAMFVYFNACLLGVFLRDNIAHAWASLLPRYREKHLLVAALIALIFLGIPMFSMAFVGTGDLAPTSVAVIFLVCLAAGLWTLHHPILGFLAIPFLVFVMTPSSFFPGFAAFLAGTNPSASAALAFISLLALLAFVWRLLAMNEGMFEYAMARVWGDLFRGRGQTFQAKTIASYFTALPTDQGADLKNFDPLKNSFTNLKQVDNLSGCSERSLWQRLQLWRLGTSPTRTYLSVGHLMLTTPLFILLFVVAGLSPRDTVVIFSVQVMTNPVIVWPGWIMRRHRLGYESLRPRTRPEFVKELGLALFWDLAQCWLAGILFMGIAAAIWAPELLQVKNFILFGFCTGVGQLCAYAIGVWPLKRGTIAGISYAFGAFMAIEFWMLFAMQGGFEVSFAIASVLAVASVATIALAYRRWCLADLD